jgi:gliding motility-associated-like protein
MTKRFGYNYPLPNLPPQGKESIISPLGETGKGLNILLLIILAFFSHSAFPQTGCSVPLPPVLTTVSVQPETGKTDLKWSLSPSPDVAAYIVYTYKEPDGLPVDTIWDPSVTTYTVASTGTKYFSISYVIASYRLSVIAGKEGCPSPLSNVLSTIFCSSSIDTCNRRISINWNKYSDFPKPVKEYKILVSVNGSPLSEIYTANRSADNFTITDFITDSQYCLAVKAVFDDGTSSTSNKSCLSTKMKRPPDWINADYATVNEDNNISLSFTADPSSEINSFSLSRKTGISGTFREIARPFSGSSTILFTDSEAKADNINYYRLSAINSCNVPVTISNLCSNMVLDINRKGDDLFLSWNSYKEWLGDISEYKLYTNTGNGFTTHTVLSVSDTLMRLSYKEIMYEVSAKEVCFFIAASESANPHGVTGESRSAQKCTAPTELITVPNVFTPDGDMLNDHFKPVLSFTPKAYHLIITSRNGKVLFETGNHLEEWDGTHNGYPHSQGVNLWFLEVTTPSGRTESKTGTVTIVRNR